MIAAKTELRAGTLPLFIGGRLQFSNKVFPTIEPATGDTLAEVSLASASDVDGAVAAARYAFDQGPWPRMSGGERAAYLMRVADLIEDRQSTLAEFESRDTGLPVRFTAEGHLPRTVAHFRYFAEEATRLVGEVFALDSAYLSLVVREAVGVAAVITPWNAPLSIASMQVAAALACGNTCVLKPSELAPVTSSMLADVMAAADLPEGVFNLIHGPAEPTGRALVEQPGIDIVSFTGGTATGKQILAASARYVRRVLCELGGKSANLILEDADLNSALDGSLLSMYANNGEACHAASRLLVARPIYERFSEMFADRVGNLQLGNPLDPDTEVGPLISEEHQARVLNFVQSGLEDGASLLAGGSEAPDLKGGYYVLPTVFANANNSMRIAREEIFGPVAVIIPFETEDEAVEMANDSDYGLAGYIWTARFDRALELASRLRVGSVSINSPMIRDIRVPFGGFKRSGIGRTGGRFSITHYTELKTICVPVQGYTFPRLGSRES
ncbi:MAG: aldehyde dehydrogenase [Acidobacteriota bacterium]